MRSVPRTVIRSNGWPITVRGRILKCTVSPVGYCSYGKSYVHRAVAEAFIGTIPPGMQVNHLDGDKLNNTPGNLAICTPSENQLHSHKHLRSDHGEKHPYGKYSDEALAEMLREVRAGSLLKDVAAKYCIDRGYLSEIKNGHIRVRAHDLACAS